VIDFREKHESIRLVRPNAGLEPIYRFLDRVMASRLSDAATSRGHASPAIEPITGRPQRRIARVRMKQLEEC
jgi:hypothetical protein